MKFTLQIAVNARQNSPSELQRMCGTSSTHMPSGASKCSQDPRSFLYHHHDRHENMCTENCEKMWLIFDCVVSWRIYCCSPRFADDKTCFQIFCTHFMIRSNILLTCMLCRYRKFTHTTARVRISCVVHWHGFIKGWKSFTSAFEFRSWRKRDFATRALTRTDTSVITQPWSSSITPWLTSFGQIGSGRPVYIRMSVSGERYLLSVGYLYVLLFKCFSLLEK